MIPRLFTTLLTFSLLCFLTLTPLACGTNTKESVDAQAETTPPEEAQKPEPQKTTWMCPKSKHVAPGCKTYPKGPYGTQPGETFPPLRNILHNCDGKAVEFHQQACDARLLLLAVSAGWCEPCMKEMHELQSAILPAFCKRGFRVVDLLISDWRDNDVTVPFCKRWTKDYDIGFPVLMDMKREVWERYIGGSSIPVNILIDTETMKVLHRWVGKIPQGLAYHVEKELKKRGL